MNKIKRITKASDCYDLHIMWSIHNKCNYHCSYCPEDLNSGDWQWLNLAKLKTFIDRIEEHYVQKLGFKNIIFSFTGGEPTLWRDFKPFIQYIEQKNFRCGLTTNGSVSTHFWKNTAEAFDYICLSFHPESADIDRFLATYKFLHDTPNIILPTVRVMMHPKKELWDKSLKLINQLKKFENWSYECVHILDDYGNNSHKIKYADPEQDTFINNNSLVKQTLNEQLFKIPKNDFYYNVQDSQGEKYPLNANQLINTEQAKFKGWKCAIGLEQLFVHYTGVVRNSGCDSSKKLGSILYPEQIRFPSSAVTCQAKSCLCPTDIRITKVAPEQKMPYSLKDPEENITAIGSSTYSPFSFRCLLTISGKTFKELPIQDYISKFNQYIQFICQQKNISAESICTYIYIPDDANFDDQEKLFSQLRKIQTFKCLNTHFSNINETLHKLLFESFDFINSDIKSVYELTSAAKLLSHYSNPTFNRLRLNLFHSEGSEARFYQILTFLLKTSSYFEFDFSNIPQESLLYKFIDKNESALLNSFGANNSEYYLRVNRKNDFAFNEMICYDSHQFSSFKAENYKHEVFNFKDWYCELGNSFQFIDFDGQIFTSFCGQKKALGSLINFEDIIFPSGDFCHQNTCINPLDQMIPKKRRSEDLL